ncbi:MAG: hypothetical protein H6835_08065 [Planctomycetes bacterium]|nr:hypothetical protein [Planctomycetota bacterium]
MSRGSPQPLARPVRPADAGTDEPADVIWTHNAYYPSPEMHEDAARALLGVCRPLAAPAPWPPAAEPDGLGGG